MTTKQLEARHPRAMQARAEKSMHHRAARAIRQWLIVFILLTAGAGQELKAVTSTFSNGLCLNNGVFYRLTAQRTKIFVEWGGPHSPYYAYATSFSENGNTEVTIPTYITQDNIAYKVTGIGNVPDYYELDFFGYATAQNSMQYTLSSSTVKRINIEGTPTIMGFSGKPTFNCPNLEEIYFLGGVSPFSGNWSAIFGTLAQNTVTAYVKGKTQAQCDNLRANHPVWGSFKAVKPYQETYSCTMSSSGGGDVFVVDLGNFSSFGSSASVLDLPRVMSIASGLTGSKTADLPSGKKYAVVFVNSDPKKIPSLKRNGTKVELEYVTYGGVKYAYYTETDLQASVNYQWQFSLNTVQVKLINQTNETTFISELGSYSNFNSNGAQNMPHLIDLNGKGSIARNRLKDANYATVYVCSDPTKTPKLTVHDGQSETYPTVSYCTYNNVQYAYYKLLPAPTTTHYYTWSTTDKTSSVTFTQKQLPDNAAKTGTVNVKIGTSQQSFSTATKTYTFKQGSTMELDIPFDQEVQTLNSIRVGGENTAFLTEDGHYKATVSVPLSNTLDVELIWNEPIPEPPVQAHQLPKATVMRKGDGMVSFLGKRAIVSPTYWTYHVIQNCNDPITTMTVSDLDANGEPLAADRWGFSVEIRPAQGQEIKSLMIGVIDTEGAQPTMRWINILDNPDYSNYLVFYTQLGKYEFDTTRGNDFPPADYTIFVDMGPETEEIENSKTLNFVRKGGEGPAFIYWNDGVNDFYFDEDGSYSVEIPNEQLTDAQMHIQVEKGETFRVFKDGEDITDQFQKKGIEYEAELETASATYTILIEKENVEAVQTIPFIDEVVKQICVENWDTHGDGELSFVEAQNVTSLGGKFADTWIETFDELKFFTSLTEIGNEEFIFCEKLKKITLPSTITTIGASAFQQCLSLQSIELPAALVEIGELAFHASGLKEIYIPANVLTINEYAFLESRLEMIVIDNENPVFESGIYYSAVIEKETQTVRVLCDNALIPDGVRILGNDPWIESMTHTAVPASVEGIGQRVFSSKLETLIMKRREPIAFDLSYFGETYLIPANCQLIVPFGTRDAYIAAGWTEDIFKGGVVEDDSILDVNGDGSVNMQDVKMVLNKSLD